MPRVRVAHRQVRTALVTRSELVDLVLEVDHVAPGRANAQHPAAARLLAGRPPCPGQRQPVVQGGQLVEAVLAVDPEAEREQAVLVVAGELQRPHVELPVGAQPQRLGRLGEGDEPEEVAVERARPLEVGDGHLHVAESVDHGINLRSARGYGNDVPSISDHPSDRPSRCCFQETSPALSRSLRPSPASNREFSTSSIRTVVAPSL